jgi:RND family efflux transporter MFP subunit
MQMFKKKKTYIILTLIILIIGGIYYYKTKKPKVEYTTSEASKGTLAQTVSVTGKIVAPEETDLSFKLSGQIEKLLVDVGDKVKKGQLIATVDKGTLLGQLRQARADVSVQKNILKNMIRRRNTYKKEDEAAQRARIRSAEAAESEILTQLGETSLYSPIDGMVIRKNVNVGEITVANAVTANTSVVTVAQEGELELESNVPESDIVKVILDQNADVTLDAFTTQTVFPAQVMEIEPASTVIQDVVYYKVKLRFPEYDQRFKNGMSADIDIHTAEKNNVVIIPLRAVKTEGNDKFVDVLQPDGITTQKIKITTGMEGDEGMVEVKSGLSGGEKVVTFTKTP